jgi:hypothetical protein
MRNSRKSPSGPPTSKQVRQLYNPPAPVDVPAQGNLPLSGANPLAFFKGVHRGDTVVITHNGFTLATAGLLFSGLVLTDDPIGSVGVLVNNYTGAPIAVPPGGFDLTVEVFFN